MVTRKVNAIGKKDLKILTSDYTCMYQCISFLHLHAIYFNFYSKRYFYFNKFLALPFFHFLFL